MHTFLQYFQYGVEILVRGLFDFIANAFIFSLVFFVTILAVIVVLEHRKWTRKNPRFWNGRYDNS